MTRARLIHLSREVLLTSAAILGALCLVMVVAGLVFGVRPLMFRSGSMAPTIDTGDLSISRTVGAAHLHRGDIVSVVAADGQRVTHRLVTNTAADGHRELTLKGDANDVVDQQVYDVTSAQKVIFTLPKLGYVVDWLSRAPGVYLVALYVGLLLMLIGRRSPGVGDGDRGEDTVDVREDRPAASERGEPTGRRHAKGGVVAAAVLGLALVAVAGWTLPTWATWNEDAAVNGTSFSSGTWAAPTPPAPVITACVPVNGNTGSNITWTWANTTPATLPADTQFKITYSNFVGPPLPSPATQDLPDNTAPYAGVTVPYNDSSGDFVLTVTTPGGTSVASNKFHFAGKNADKTCAQVP